jgi:hypothetical protein
MISFVILHLSYWGKEKWRITSPHLRSAGIMLVCFTVLSVLLFGMRLFLKPDVAITYQNSSDEMYKNLVVTPTSEIVESKKLLTCVVGFEKTYPTFLLMGRDVRNSIYRLPCDVLTTDMKSDIAATVSYLKEDGRNAK